MRCLSVVLRPLLRAGAVSVGTPRSPTANSLRSFTTTTPLSAVDRRRLAGAVQIKTIDDKIAELPLDRKIDTPEVIVKSEDDQLGEPQDLIQLLRQVKHQQKYVLQLTKPGDFEHAVVRIVERQHLVNLIRKREDTVRNAQVAQKAKKPKQIELNWAISENDLQLKLNQMGEFLGKGKKVELLLANKRHQRKASIDEAQALLKKIHDKIHDVGARQLGDMEGHILRQATITVQIPT